MAWTYEWNAWTWGALGLLVLAGLMFIRAALVRRRRRGVHCPTCGYDMHATPAIEIDDRARGVYRCPECGKETRGEKNLRRRGPWRWWARAGVVLIAIASQVAEQPARRYMGEPASTSWVPTSVLLWTVPWLRYGNSGPCHNALLQRNERMWTWQRIVAVRLDERPNAAATTRLIDGPKVWPITVPLPIELEHGNDPAAGFIAGRLVELGSPWAIAGPGLDEALFKSLWVLDCWYRESAYSRRLLVKLPSVGLHRVPVSVSARAFLDPEYTVPVWQRDVTHQVRAVATAEEAIKVVRSPKLDAQVRAAITLKLDLWWRDDPAAPAERTPADLIKLAGMSIVIADEKLVTPIGMRVEVLERGTSVGTSLWADEQSIVDIRYRSDFRVRVDAAAMARLRQRILDAGSVERGMEGWTLRITGDPEQSLLGGARASCWGGVIEGPLWSFVREDAAGR